MSSPFDPSSDPLADILAATAHRAGKVILDIYNSDFAVAAKDDKSPVTEADGAGETVILEALSVAFPDIPVIAEEAVSAGQVPDIGNRFFLVDPLDGTREFIKRNGEFTVNIGLVDNGVPVAGVVYAPAIDMLLVADEAGARETAISVETGLSSVDWRAVSARPAPASGVTVVASRSHRDADTDAFLADIDVSEIRSAGSSLKFCLVARGDADLYPRFGPTMEWDTAAGDAILRRAGGTVTDTDGNPFRYGKTAAGYRNPGFIARGKAG
ncbi:MAG: 3'(2'),5'-bisphosphate nucleotidase CysQ [Pseudomonadota bacterium]